jgi:anthranilate 1,2-dioxygenase small subunit
MSDAVVAAKSLHVSPGANAAIARLMTQYVHAIDNDELERWPQFFTAQGMYQIIPRTAYEQGHPVGVWFCDNRDMLEDRVSSVREVNVFEPHVYRHIIGPAEILEFSDGVYRTQSSYIVVRTMHDGEMCVFSAGRYVDEIVIEQDVALLQKRIVVTDSARFDTLVVIPL